MKTISRLNIVIILFWLITLQVEAQSINKKEAQIIHNTPRGKVTQDISRYYGYNYNASVAQGEWGRHTQTVDQYWDPYSADWENSWNNQIGYEPQYTGPICGVGNPGWSNRTETWWSNGNWEYPTTTTSVYDPSFNHVTGWNSTGHDGLPFQSATYTGFSCCGHATEEVVIGADGLPHWRTVTEYNQYCNMVGERNYSWDSNLSQWDLATGWDGTWIQPGCPDTWTFYYGHNGVLYLDYMARFIYGDLLCMGDQAPFHPWYVYSCNPTLVHWSYTLDNGVTYIPWWTDGITHNDQCQSTEINSYYTPEDVNGGQPFERIFVDGFESGSTSEWSSIPKIGKILDNSTKRITKAVSQLYTNGAWVNNWRSFDSYEDKQLDTDNALSLPNMYLLSQNYPNPFNPITSISYEIPEESIISIKVYNSLGNEIKTLINEFKPIGTYQVNWDGTDNSGDKASGGTYFCQLKAGDFIQTRKMVLLK